MFVYTGGNGTAAGVHIGMVQKVTPASDGSVTLGNIKVIEATYQGQVGNVQDVLNAGNVVSDYSQDSWVIVRLK